MKRAFSRPLAFGLLLLVAVLPGAAQQTSPPSGPKDAPKPDVRLKPGDSTSTEDEHPKHHRFGLKFWIPWGIAIGAQVAAVEATQRCLQAHTCGVSSPVFGGRPSRVKMYSILGALDAANFYLSWNSRKEGDSAFWWMAPPITLGAGAAYSLSDVLRHQHHPTAAPAPRIIANMPASEVVPVLPPTTLGNSVGRPKAAQVAQRRIANMPASEVVPVERTH